MLALKPLFANIARVVATAVIVPKQSGAVLAEVATFGNTTGVPIPVDVMTNFIEIRRTIRERHKPEGV